MNQVGRNSDEVDSSQGGNDYLVSTDHGGMQDLSITSSLTFKTNEKSKYSYAICCFFKIIKLSLVYKKFSILLKSAYQIFLV